MRFAALRTITLALLVVCLACAGDTISPTQIEDLTTFTAEGHKPKHNPGGDGPSDPATYTFDITINGKPVNSRPIFALGDVTNFHGDENSGITMDMSFLTP